MTRRVLLIAYQFPPVGGAGVQRPTKWVKYLRRTGWEPTVVTVERASVPVVDHSLMADIPEGTRIVTGRSLEPGYAAKQAVSGGAGSGARSGLKSVVKSALRATANVVLQPDPQILWLPDAMRQAQRELDRQQYDAILATAPPFSSFVLAAKLARKNHIPLVVDYRDEWDISSVHWENKSANAWTRMVQQRQQRAVLQAADAVIATTWNSVRAVSKHCHETSGPKLFACIPNGFDPADFPHRQAPPAGGPLRIAYVGTLWNLASAEPLVRGVQALSQTAPRLLAELHLIFAGRRTAAQEALLDQLEPLPCRVERRDYVDHVEALKIQQDSQVLCAFLSDVPEANRVIPAKIFEAMAAQRHLLGIAPPGEMWNTLADYPIAMCLEPSDVDGIHDTLASLIQRHQCGQLEIPEQLDFSRFDRRQQTQQLADVLDSVASSRSSDDPASSVSAGLEHAAAADSSAHTVLQPGDQHSDPRPVAVPQSTSFTGEGL